MAASPGDDPFFIITNREIYQQLVKLREELTLFAGLRESLDIHATGLTEHAERISQLEQHAARMWFVRPVSVAAMAAVVGDILSRVFHLV